MKIVEITWLDASMETGTIFLELAKTLSCVQRTNVGYIIEKNEEKVIFCFGTIYDKEHDKSGLCDTMVIPAGDVIKIKYLGDCQCGNNSGES